MNKRRRTKISKAMSYFLRHDPGAGDLEPDEYGFVSMDALLEALQRQYGPLSKDVIRRVVADDPKGRYEISGDTIRATYGHSIDVEDIGRPCEPPDELYHGTPRDNIEAIRKKGLQPMGRQQVHLSETIDDAIAVGKRRDSKPAVFVIDCRKASELGVKFRKSGSVYLADTVPPDCLRLLSERCENTHRD